MNAMIQLRIIRKMGHHKLICFGETQWHARVQGVLFVLHVLHSQEMEVVGWLTTGAHGERECV